MPRDCICNHDQCGQVPKERRHPLYLPKKLDVKDLGPCRTLFTCENLAKWCYSYLGYSKQSPANVKKVEDLVTRWESGKKLRLNAHHFEDCFLDRNEAGGCKLSHKHHSNLCQANQDSGQDTSHSEHALLVPSAKPDMFSFLAESRLAEGTHGMLGLRARSAPTRLSPGPNTPRSVQPALPRTNPPTSGAQNPAPPSAIPDPVYLSSAEKRS